MSNPTDSQLSTATRNAVTAWTQAVAEFDKVLAALDDTGLQRTVAADRNRVYYLLGHLVAVHDRMFPLLRVGERRYANLDEEFLTKPDGAMSTRATSAADLRAAWTDTNTRLTAALEKLQSSEWFERHDNVSPEDFAKEPHRNRFAVLLSRTSHLAMHHGQALLALPKK